MGKVKQELNRKTTTEKVEYGENVVTQLTGNANFSNPNPSLVEVKDTITNVRTAYADSEAARKMAQTKTSLLYQQESKLDSVLVQLGAYVENVSNGDEALIFSAGMGVQKGRTSTGIPDKITSVNATIGDNAGEIDLSWDKVANAKSYAIETALNTTTLDWKHALVCTKSKAEITGLQRGVEYQIRASAIGAVGQGPWSDPVLKVAP